MISVNEKSHALVQDLIKIVNTIGLILIKVTVVAP